MPKPRKSKCQKQRRKRLRRVANAAKREELLSLQAAPSGRDLRLRWSDLRTRDGVDLGFDFTEAIRVPVDLETDDPIGDVVAKVEMILEELGGEGEV